MKEAYICRCWDPWPLSSPAREYDIRNPWRVYAAPQVWMVRRLVRRTATLEAALRYARRTYPNVEVDDVLPSW